MARLRIAFRGAETVVPLGGGETTVGRSNRCSIHLPDPDLADVHFVIREKSRGWQLRDKGSGLGTQVNGKPVFATTLTDGDVIVAGGLSCVFLVKDRAPESAASARPRRARSARPERPERPERPQRPERSERGRSPRPAKGPPIGLLVGIGLGVVAIGVVLFLLQRGQAAEEEARELWAESKRLDGLSREEPARAEEHVLAQVQALKSLRADYAKTRLARAAAGALSDAERTLAAFKALKSEERRVRGGLTEADAQDAYARIARAGRAPHPAVAERAARVEDLVKQSLTAALEKRFADARAKAEAHAANERFGAALTVLAEFARDVPRLGDRIRGAEAELAKRIANRYRAALRAAGRGGDLAARIELLEAHRDAFRGTRHTDDLEVRISVLRARRHARAIVVPRRPDPQPEPGREGETGDKPAPVPAGPYEDPPRVLELIKVRRYAEAAQVLNSISRHPDAKTRVEELTLMATVLADLTAAVKQRPGDFIGVLLPERGGRGDAVAAGSEGITVRKSDGTSRLCAWADLPAKGLPKLLRQAGLLKRPRLGTAILFDEAGLDKDARRAYVAFHRASEGVAENRSRLTRILARRRGIPAPRDFVVFRAALVTPAEQERTLLMERIEKLARKARTTSQDKLRREAWEELERIGDPAREALIAVVSARRALLAAELERHRAFSPSRFAAKFGGELKQRRSDALAYILDSTKYPYPNKTDAAQAEAERLVKRVRELYDEPYALLLGKSTTAQAIDRELRDLDERLAKYDPLSEPLHEKTVAKIQGGLDVGWIALDERDKKRHSYNRDVLAYNESLKTSADAEERDNVLAVNEYRHMMGLFMVKIDERLVRASRKHSIEMVQLDYFAHNSRTPHLRTPGHRARREGYPSGVAENIARGASTGRGAFWQWFRSSGHHRNMLNPGHRELGCGACKHHWWTQKFGRATGTKLTAPKVPPDPDPPGESGNGMPPPR